MQPETTALHDLALRHLPPSLLAMGPRQLARWQWLALPVVVALSWLTGVFLGRLTRALGSRLVRGSSAARNRALFARFAPPITFAWTIGVAAVLVEPLALRDAGAVLVDRWLRAGFFVAFFWALLRGVDVTAQAARDATWARGFSHSRSLVPLGTRVAKVAVWAIALVALLADFGYPVASLVAGLGIGGLAVALAAQETLRNLFGAFAIGIDQPFREGDYVRIDDLQGTVESVGLRSTRIRTLDRTQVTIPNGKLAELRIESFAPRDRIRLATVLGLRPGTTGAQVRAVLAGLEAALRAHPKVRREGLSVRLVRLGDSSLDVEVIAFVDTAEWDEFQRVREALLLRFLEVIEEAGTELAHPARNLFLHPPRG